MYKRQDTIHEILQKRDMAAEASSFENIFYASDLSENFVNMIDSKMCIRDKYRNKTPMQNRINGERKAC